MSAPREFTMAKSIFADRAHQPTPDSLEQALGHRRPLWTALLTSLLDVAPGTAGNWAFYKKSTGWLLRVQRGKFTICTVLPTPDALLVVFLMPERAVLAAREAALPEVVTQAMDGASVSKFGHAFDIHVKDEALLPALATLARIKLETR